jgi:hypothetical protein
MAPGQFVEVIIEAADVADFVQTNPVSLLIHLPEEGRIQIKVLAIDTDVRTQDLRENASECPADHLPSP